MQAIEFQATAYQHTIPIPKTIPNGATFRVLLLLDDVTEKIQPQPDLKKLLAQLTHNLTDADLQRSDELARIIEWDI
jgi:hypothetical protein